MEDSEAETGLTVLWKALVAALCASLVAFFEALVAGLFDCTSCLARSPSLAASAAWIVSLLA